MKKLLTFLAPVVTGDDNKLSIKRLIVITFVVEVVRIIERDKLTNDYVLSAFYALLGSILVILGIVTFAQLQNVKLGSIFTSKTEKVEKIETITGTSTTDTTTIMST